MMEFKRFKGKIESLIKSPKFAYFYGYFVADGSFYEDSSGTRFEFSDGTSVEEELKYSSEFLTNIKKMVEGFLNKTLPNLRRKGNRFVLSFRSKDLDFIFRKCFNLKPGIKSFSVNLPAFYTRNSVEKYFWLGVMDGDGMVARKNRKISLEIGSLDLYTSFKDFLNREKIIFRDKRRLVGKNKFFGVDIKTTFFKDYCSKLGFLHPRKRLWLLKHLKKIDFYRTNLVDIQNFTLKKNIINYAKIFDSDRIMIVNGKNLLIDYGFKHRGRKNRRFTEILEKFDANNFPKIDLFEKLSKYRWKMSKGSTNSVRMPLYFNKCILDVANFIRIQEGSVRIPRNYIKSFNINPQVIIKKIEKVFDIKPKYTSKKEPIFCSGVLKVFFSKIINKSEEKQVLLPKWHTNLN